MRRTILISLIAIFSLTGVGAAQEAPCGLRTMTEGATPVYPPIARAAHVTGTVVMLARFKLDGAVEDVQVLYGPIMLRQSAIIYVKSWKANVYGGSRTCPVVIDYVLDDLKIPDAYKRVDIQHVTIYRQTVVLDGGCCTDPMPYPLSIEQRIKYGTRRLLRRFHILKPITY